MAEDISALRKIITKMELLPLRGWLLFLFQLATIASAFFAFEFIIDYLDRSTREAVRSFEQAHAIEKMSHNLLRAESAQRGYLLTGNEAFLESFRSSMKEWPRINNELHEAVSKDPDLKSLTNELDIIAAKKQQIMVYIMNLVEAADKDNALKVVQSGEGKVLMDVLLEKMQVFQEKAIAGIDSALEQRKATLNRTRIFVVSTIVISLFLLVMLLNWFLAFLEQKKAFQKNLEAQKTFLLREIGATTKELLWTYKAQQERVEEERSQFARELHDELGSILIAAKIDAAWLGGHFETDDAHPELKNRMRRLLKTLDEAVGEKRRVIENLHPSLLDNLGLLPALEWHVEETCKRAGIAYELKFDDTEEKIPKNVALALYRIVQEGLNNAVKHAHCSRVEVKFTSTDGAFRLCFKDDGRGIQNYKKNKLSHGLAGMRARIRTLDGEFDLITAPGKGTTIEVVVPKPKEVTTENINESISLLAT